MNFNSTSVKQSLFGLLLMVAASGCLFRDDPRPDSYLDNSEKLTTPDLRIYMNPYCRLDPNTVSCNFLNYNFENLEVVSFNRDSVVAIDKNSSKNRISIVFQNLFDQNGTYKITPNSYLQALKNNEVYVTLRGNKYGNNSMVHYLKNGDISVKQTDTGFDLAFCDAGFDYYLNGVLTSGQISGHFIVKR